MAPAPNRTTSKPKADKPKVASVKEFTEEQARKLLERKETEKQKAFLDEYQALCAKHGYQVAAVPMPAIQLTIVPFNSKG